MPIQLRFLLLCAAASHASAAAHAATQTALTEQQPFEANRHDWKVVRRKKDNVAQEHTLASQEHLSEIATTEEAGKAIRTNTTTSSHGFILAMLLLRTDFGNKLMAAAASSVIAFIVLGVVCALTIASLVYGLTIMYHFRSQLQASEDQSSGNRRSKEVKEEAATPFMDKAPSEETRTSTMSKNSNLSGRSTRLTTMSHAAPGRMVRDHNIRGQSGRFASERSSGENEEMSSSSAS
jgi:hypothetical protein